MANRCLNIIEELEREQEHARRMNRVQRSSEMYAAAVAEANKHGVILTHDNSRFVMSDNRHVVWFCPATNSISRKRIAPHECRERVEINAEVDVLDVLLMFQEGRFLK